MVTARVHRVHLARRLGVAHQCNRRTDRQTDGGMEGMALKQPRALCAAAAVTTPITSGYELLLLLL